MRSDEGNLGVWSPGSLQLNRPLPIRRLEFA